MDDDWLEIADKSIHVEEIMRKIRERVARRGAAPSSGETGDPATVAKALWKKIVADPEDPIVLDESIAIRQRDCDVVPRYYVIDWRIPILGPIHAVVRRLIDAEIRRYLFPSLEKQSRLNRRVRHVLRELIQENARLRQRIEELGGSRE